MRARWVSEINAGKGTIGRTMVASFWPGKYYLVDTIHQKGDDPFRDLERLTRSLQTGAGFEEVTLADCFDTLVWRCSRDMIFTSEVLYEQKYPNEEEAELGHQEVVRKLAQGRLKLPRPRQWGRAF